MMHQCFICNLFYKEEKMKKLQCQRHFECQNCSKKNKDKYCQTCQVGTVGIMNSNQILHNYPIQGFMVNYHKTYNFQGQSEFTSRSNCFGRTAAWTMFFFLGLVFFFSGLAMAILGSQRGTGVIMAIIGAVGLFFSIFFICKIKRIDRQLLNRTQSNQDRFIYIKNEIKQERRIISSVGSDIP